MTNDYEVINNTEDSRFEVHLDGHVAMLEYQIAGRQIVFPHTEVPDELGGKGIGSTMAKTALTYAKDEGYRVVPLCPFVISYIRRHPEWKELVVGRTKED